MHESIITKFQAQYKIHDIQPIFNTHQLILQSPSSLIGSSVYGVTIQLCKNLPQHSLNEQRTVLTHVSGSPYLLEFVSAFESAVTQVGVYST